MMTPYEKARLAGAEAILAEHARGGDVADFVAQIISTAAAAAGGTWRLLSARSGSWEATLVAELTQGTCLDAAARLSLVNELHRLRDLAEQERASQGPRCELLGPTILGDPPCTFGPDHPGSCSWVPRGDDSAIPAQAGDPRD